MDFTLLILETMLKQFLFAKYNFSTFNFYLESILFSEKVLIIRHDVDLLPENSLATAKLEHSLKIQGTYYFRVIPETFKPAIIKEIADLGHEIGYHYEDMDLVNAENLDQHIDSAFESFKRNLEKLRKIVPINTICMHGSPKAKYDNKLIWSKYNYRELGIIGEPYYDIDFNEFAYFTDTGRRWNGEKYSVRDRVNSKYKFDFKRTEDIIRNVDKLPDKMMITVHPQRWTDEVLPWAKELVWQNSKNLIKRFLVRVIRCEVRGER